VVAIRGALQVGTARRRATVSLWWLRRYLEQEYVHVVADFQANLGAVFAQVE
jgi:hypothetical protein